MALSALLPDILEAGPSCSRAKAELIRREATCNSKWTTLEPSPQQPSSSEQLPTTAGCGLGFGGGWVELSSEEELQTSESVLPPRTPGLQKPHPPHSSEPPPHNLAHPLPLQWFPLAPALPGSLVKLQFCANSAVLMHAWVCPNLSHFPTWILKRLGKSTRG